MAKKNASAVKKSNAAQAGNRRAALRAQQEAAAKKAKRNRILIVVAAVVALALVVGLVVWAINRAPKQATPTPSATAPATATSSEDTQPSTPAISTPQVVPPDGNSTDVAQAAWITVPSKIVVGGSLAVDIHTDYQCPYCQVAEKSYATLFEQLSDGGGIVLRQHTRTFLNGVGGEQGNSSTRAAIAAACVDFADRTKYAAYHNLIFTNQPQEGTGFTDDQLRNAFAADAGLTDAALTSFQSCYDNQATAQWVANAESNNMNAVANAGGSPKYLFGSDTALCYTQDANGSMKQVDCSTAGATPMGVMGTPTFFVNGVRFSLSDLFDSNWTPLYKTPEDLLTFLQQKANS